MKKTKVIGREIFIILLICIAISLVLAIILYGYSPSGKIVPNKVAYTRPDNISQEISSSDDITKQTPVTITYELDETNINNSKKNGSYNSGRQNPFAKVEEENTEDSESTNENNNNSVNNTNNEKKTNTTSETNSSSKKNNETSYLPNTGTK